MCAWVSGQFGIDQMQLTDKYTVAPDQILKHDIAVDIAQGEHMLNPRNPLIGDHEDCLQCELSTAILEKAGQRRTKQIHNDKMVVLRSSAAVNKRNARTAS